MIKFDKVDKDLSDKIISNSNLDERKIIFKILEIYPNHEKETIYFISEEKIQNNIFIAKLEDKEYIAKNIKETFYKNFKRIQREIYFNFLAFQNNLSPKMFQILLGENCGIIIMEKLEKTFESNILSLSLTQNNNIINNIKKIVYENNLNYDVDEKNFFSENFIEIFNSVDTALNKRQKWNILQDDNQQREIRKREIRKLFDLIKSLHEINVFHGDSHLKNFMYDKEEKLFAIDFEFSTFIQDEIIANDYIKIIDNIEYYTKNGYTNLNYLVDYCKEISGEYFKEPK